MNRSCDTNPSPTLSAVNSFSDRDLNWLALLLALLFFLAPLYPQLTSIKYAFFFRSFLFLLMGVTLYRLGGSTFFSQIKSSPIIPPTLFWLLLMGLGVLYSPDPYRAKAKLALGISAFLLLGLGVILPFKSSQRRILMQGMIGGAAAAAGYALYLQWTGNFQAIQALKQYTLYEPVMQNELLQTLKANRAMGSFANPNHMAGYLVLSLFPLWFLWKAVRPGIYRWGYAGIGVLLLLTIYQTYSRSGLLALFLALLLIAGYELSQKKFPYSVRVLSIIAVILLLLGIITLYFFRDRLLGGRLFTLSTITARFHFFRGGLLIIRDHPWFGVGLEGFESFYCSYLRPGDLESRYVHNWLLEAALELGIPGLIGLFWLMGAIGKMGFRSRLSEPHQSFLSFSAFGSAAILFALSEVDFHNNLMEMVMIPAFLLGCANESTAGVKRKFQVPKYAVAFLAGGMILLWGGLVLCRFVNEISRENAYLLVIDGQTAVAKLNYERAVGWDRTDAESWNGLSRMWATLPTPTGRLRSLECMEQAVRWSPHRASLRADYADTLMAMGFSDRAVEEMQTAIKLFPARPNYPSRLAEYYRLLNQPEKAKTEQEKAAQITEQIKERKI